MALTNFGTLLDEQKTVWARDVWAQARNLSFINRFAGEDQNAMVHRITELTKTEKGSRAVITLVPDLEDDGTAGDNQLEGREEGIKAYDQVIQIDQLRHANVSQGRMAEQKVIVSFRETSRDVLAYWLADRLDQMAFLTLSGVTFDTKTNGAARDAGSQLQSLDFAADVTAPSSNRYFRWDATDGLVAGNTAAVAAADTPSYEMLVRTKATLFDKYIRPIRGEGGNELFHVFMSPQALAALKLDSDFLTNVRQGMPRSENNQLFKGNTMYDALYVDGMVIHSHRHVFNTAGLVSGTDKWGAGNDVDGCRVLFCGAQALGMADLGPGYWVEEYFDYQNRPGISYGKICGLKKPVFRSQYESTPSDEDYGVIAVDVAV